MRLPSGGPPIHHLPGMTMTLNRKAAAVAAALALSGALPVQAADTPDRSIARKVDALLKRMTLEEKAGQLHQISGRQMTGPGSVKFADKLADIRAGRVGSMLNVKGVADTREIQTLAMQSRRTTASLCCMVTIRGCRFIR